MFTEFIYAHEYICMLPETQNSCNMKSNMLPYTHNCDVSKRNPDFQIALTSHHSFWKNKPQSSSCYTKILIHATFSKVNFASNNRRTHHNISLSKQPNHGTISKTEAQWSLLVSSSIPPTSRRRRCGGSYCLRGVEKSWEGPHHQW